MQRRSLLWLPAVLFTLVGFFLSESTTVAASLVLGWFLSGVVARVPVDDEPAE